MEIVKSKYTGYCQGVKKALNIVEKTRNENEKSKIYLYGSLIHNEQIYHKLKSLNITQIPFGAKISLLNSDDIIIFSAHGHPIHVENDLNQPISYALPIFVVVILQSVFPEVPFISMGLCISFLVLFVNRQDYFIKKNTTELGKYKNQQEKYIDALLHDSLYFFEFDLEDDMRLSYLHENI